MTVLVINAGSSSLKFQLFDMDTHEVKAKGLCERIGIDGRYKYTAAGRDAIVNDYEMKSHSDAIRILIELLTDKETGVIASLEEIDAVGHRVLPAGEKISESVIVDQRVKDIIRECIPIGPLHNPANLMGIEACEEVMPGVPQVAVFDTAFHQTMPPEAYLYAIPYEYYEKYMVRRYGFHGTSHRYVSGEALKILGNPDAKVVTCHLGNGSSIAAVDAGKCVDTSMGLTPLEGLPMGTRSGSIDPAIVSFIAENEGLTATEVVNILNKKSGVLGVTGVSSDFRDIDAAVEAGNERAKIALKMFNRSIEKYIGGYACIMGGLDAIVFTAGIGENNSVMRREICDDIAFLGVKIDPEKNAHPGKDCIVSAPDSKVKVLVIPTNEELVIAMDTAALVAKN